MVTFVVLRITAVVLLVAANAFFVAAEFALVSIRETRLQQLIAAHRIGARTVQKLHQKLDEFIADCEHHLKVAPQDELAREYLYNAYQQKTELLSAMMDRGRSVN